MNSHANKNIGRIARLLAIAAVLLFPLAASAAQDKTLRAPARPPAPAAAPAKPHLNVLREAEAWSVWGENRIKDFSGEVGGIRLDRFLIKPELRRACGLPGDESAVASAEYYFGDALQSVHQVTNAAGAVVRTQFTDAWGNDLDIGIPSLPTGPGDRYGFQNREKDAESGLQFFRARSYDPMTGRFTSRDPFPKPNLYIFPGNNPVNMTDPSGMLSREDEAYYVAMQVLYEKLGSSKLVQLYRDLLFHEERKDLLVKQGYKKDADKHWKWIQSYKEDIEAEKLQFMVGLAKSKTQQYAGTAWGREESEVLYDLNLAANVWDDEGIAFNKIGELEAFYMGGRAGWREYRQSSSWAALRRLAGVGAIFSVGLMGSAIPQIKGGLDPVLDPTKSFRPPLNSAKGTIRVLEGPAGATGGPSNGMYTFFHGTDAAGAESLVSAGILPKGAQEGEFFGTVSAARAAGFGGKVVEVTIPEEMFLDLVQSHKILRSPAHADSFVITVEGQQAINAALGK